MNLSLIAQYKNIPRKEDLEFLIKQCYKAEEIRNQIIHSLWTSGPRMKIVLNKKRGLEHKFENYSEEELRLIATKIDKIDTAIDALKFDYLCNNYQNQN